MDEHGQPLNRFFNRDRVQDRSVNELIGLCHGIVADGVVNQKEAEYLENWLSSNRHVLDKWPANIISDRVFKFLTDGVLDKEEARELFEILCKMVGADRNEAKLETTVATTLPFTAPAPCIVFEEREFCFTGKFAMGTRKQVSSEAARLGALVRSSVTVDLDYLVIGEFGSRDWIQSPYGRKIERVMAMREEGKATSVVSEQHFAEAILADTSDFK